MSTPPPPNRNQMDVWYSPEGIAPDECPDADLIYHRLILTHADELAAEKQCKARGLLLEKDRAAYVSLWVWCALARREHITDRWETWRDRVLNIADVKRDAPAADPAHTDDDDSDRPTEASPISG